MTVALVPRPLELGSLSDPAELGRMLAASGYFEDVKEAAQAVVKVLAGAELGIPAIASMTGVYIVKGRVTLSATMMAALVKRSQKYDYKVRERSAQKAAIAFFEGAEELGVSEFTIEMAQKAGLGGDTWRKYPENMLFARAMTNGVKSFAPDVFAGAPVYTPDELGAEIDAETGELIAMPAGAQVTELRTPPPPPPETIDVSGHTVDKATGEVQEPPTETPPAPAEPAPDPEPAPAPETAAAPAPEAEAPVDADAPMTNAEFAKLISYFDALKVPMSTRQMWALANDVDDLAQLNRGAAHALMVQAKERFG